MARYNLFLPDYIYTEIYKIACSEGLSFGKKVNEILAEYVEKHNSAEEVPSDKTVLIRKKIGDRKYIVDKVPFCDLQGYLDEGWEVIE